MIGSISYKILSFGAFKKMMCQSKINAKESLVGGSIAAHLFCLKNMVKTTVVTAMVIGIYLVCLASVSPSNLYLTIETGDFNIEWYNPASGVKMLKVNIKNAHCDQINSG